MSDDRDIPLVLALDDASATVERVGGKGASLARLAAAGLPVPPGFHITTAAYRRFVGDNQLQADILAAVASATADDPAALEAASRQIGELFAQHAMPDDIAQTIRRAYAQLGGADLPVAVRSSATAEDLPELSFAGQQETYLNMRGDAMVLDAVQRCWASLWTARAIGYRARQGIAPQEVSLAVTVQELVPAEAAGILFTANPLTGARDQAMVSAAWGLGEAIVGGQVTPDTLTVDKASGAIIEQQINAKDVMTVRTSDGTREEPVPAERRRQAVLSPEQAAELARLGGRIEALYVRPMDVEWTLHEGRISVVQARPITALPEPVTAPTEARAGDWQLPNPKGRYMRTSVFELLPDPLSPLFATIGLPAFGRAMVTMFRSVGLADRMPDLALTTINGYGYYDLTLTPTQSAKLLVALPRILIADFPPLLRTAQSRWEAARARYAGVVRRWQATDLAAAPAERLLSGAGEVTAEAADYYLTVQSGILPAAYMSELFFTLVYNRLLKRGNAPPALTFVLGFDSVPMQAEKSLYDLAQWARGRPELGAALTNATSEEFDAAYRAGPVAAVDEATWSAFRQRYAAHLARFGDAIYDLDFAKAVPAEDPASMLETLRFFLSGRAPDPYRRQEATAAARERAVRTMVARLHGPRLSVFRALVGWAQRLAPLREDALAGAGLGWPVLRAMLREIGRRLTAASAIDHPDDVFWLTLDELREAAAALDAGQTPADGHAVASERRATWEGQRALTPPVALPVKGGARFLGIDFTRTMPARSDQPEGDVLKGIGASPGRVTGPARVLHGPAEFGQMRQGDILVARITTPAWTPLFALAAGVVTDVGGPLSHSSIVAREYHIPAVLGTGMATGRLSSGQRVTVDGDSGTVTALK